MNLFEVENLHKTYFGEEVETKVLRGLNFVIESGEFVAIMGPSGSGKSTLLHILGFLDGYTSGSCKFKGKKFENYSENEAARLRNKEIGFVFQQFNLLSKETVYQNVLMPLLYSGLPAKSWRQKVEKVVDIVGLSHRINYETYKLSGGEKQRVAIARALVNDPDVIFADEPTGNLDSKSGSIVMQTFQRLHDEFGHTIILITHESQTAKHAHRIIKIKDGKIESDKEVKNPLIARSFTK